MNIRKIGKICGDQDGAIYGDEHISLSGEYIIKSQERYTPERDDIRLRR